MTTPAHVSDFRAFVEAVASRLDAGAAAYGDRSFDLPPAELVREIEEELEDVAAWGFILWCRLRRLREAAERLEVGAS